MKRGYSARRGMRYVAVLAAICCGICHASAQLRILSQEQLEAVGNPRLADGAQSLRFSRTNIDLGTIDEDAAPVKVRFECVNVGHSPLVITRVTTSCSCLTAEYDRQPIAANDRAKISVEYRQKGHPGVFSRQIFVYTQLSASAPTAVLTLSGVVEQGANRFADYPYPKGALRLRQIEVHFDATSRERQVQRIAFANTGTTAVTLCADTLLTPPYVTLHTDPRTVFAGAMGDLVITLRGDLLPATPPKNLPLLYQGVDAAPSARTLKLYLDGIN